MKYFYKIESEQLYDGSGTKAPSGYIEYEKGQEPDELIIARIKQKEEESE